MPLTRPLLHTLTFCLALVCAGCGGSAGDTTATSAPAPVPVQRTTPRPAADIAFITPDQLMDWAEDAVPELFPGHSASVAGAGYVYRYHAGASSTISVADDGKVHVTLPVLSSQPLYMGPLAGFNCAVVHVDCPDAGVDLVAGSVGGPGYINAPVGHAARFIHPYDTLMDAQGNLYVADDSNAVRKVTPAGAVTTLAGNPFAAGPVRDGTGSSATFSSVKLLGLDAQGNLYLPGIGQGLRQVTPAGVVTTLATVPPMGRARDALGNFYVIDTYAVKKVNPDGISSVLAGKVGVHGNVDGPVDMARLGELSSITADAQGNVYVVDYSNQSIRKISAAGVVSTLAGRRGALRSEDGTGSAAAFYAPFELVLDRAGNLFVTDYTCLRKVTPQGVATTFAGACTNQGGNLDGQGNAARFWTPVGLSIDPADNLYLADMLNNTLRKITPSGYVTTLAGMARATGPAVGSVAKVSFQGLAGVATDAAGNLYVADGEACTILKITPDGQVSTLAGSAGQRGAADGQGSAARFFVLRSITTDAAGNLYATDGLNLRKITPQGMVSTLGNDGKFAQVGTVAAQPKFSVLQGVLVDEAGNVYVADSGNSVVWKVTPQGDISPLAGTPQAKGHVDGAAASAKFRTPTGLARDAAGNVYVTDSEDRTVRKITPAGVVSTLAGSAGMSGHVDGTGSQARFATLGGVAVDAQGNLYVHSTFGGDTGNVRKITPGGTVTTLAGNAQSLGTQLGSLQGSLPPISGIALGADGLLYAASAAALLKLRLP